MWPMRIPPRRHSGVCRGVDLWHRLGCLKSDRIQELAAAIQNPLPGRITVGLQYEGQDVRIAVATETARSVERHGGTNTVEQISDRQAVEIGDEQRTHECGSFPDPAQHGAETHGAI